MSSAYLYHGNSFCVMCLSSFLDIAVSIFDFAPYYAEFDRILNSSYLKSVVFLIDIYIPWSKFYMSGN